MRHTPTTQKANNMARRHKSATYISLCAVCGTRINKRSGIGFTPSGKRTCSDHNGKGE